MNTIARRAQREKRAVTMTPEFEVSPAQLTTMACLLRRLGMADVEAPGDMGRLAAYASTHHLWKLAPWPDVPPPGVSWVELRQGQNGSHLSSLYIWGFLTKIATTAPNAEFTPKGWAYLVYKGLVPADHIVFLKRASSDFVILVNELVDRFKAREALKAAISVDSLDALAKGVIQDITEGNTLFDNLPYSGNTVTVTPDETLVTLSRPQYDDVTLDAWRKRSGDEEQMRLAREALVRKWRGPEFASDAEIEHSISKYLTPVETLEADWSAMQDRQGAWWRHELISRMSTRGAFHTPTLGDHTDGDRLLRGVHRIAAGIEAGELGRAGVELGLPPETTLGDVYDRLQAQRGISEQPDGSGTDSWGRDIEELPIVDWIEATMDAAVSNQDSEPFVLLDDAKKIARKAALRVVRNRINRAPLELPDDVFTHRSAWHKALEFNRDCAAPASEDMDDRGYWQHEIDVFDRTFDALTRLRESGDILPSEPKRTSDGGGYTEFDGHFFHVIRTNMMFEDRPMTLRFSISGDHDEADEANVEAFVNEAVARMFDYRRPVGKHPALAHPYGVPEDVYAAVAAELGIGRDEAKRRFLWTGYGGKVEHTRVGEVATLKARWGAPPWLSVILGAVGGVTALGGFLAFLHFVVR